MRIPGPRAREAVDGRRKYVNVVEFHCLLGWDGDPKNDIPHQRWEGISPTLTYFLAPSVGRPDMERKTQCKCFPSEIDKDYSLVLDRRAWNLSDGSVP